MFDQTPEYCYQSLNIGGKKKQTTMVGGALSLCIDAMLFYIAYVKFDIMVNRLETLFSSLKQSYTSREVTRLVDYSPTFVFYINTGGDDPWDDIPLENDTRKYMHVRVENLHRTFDQDGKKKDTITYHPMVRCSEKYFKTEYE